MKTEEYLALRDSVIFLPRITDRPEHRVMPLYTGWAGTLYLAHARSCFEFRCRDFN